MTPDLLISEVRHREAFDLVAELLAQLQTVARVASTRSAVQALSGVQIVADGGASSCARPTWRSACASR